MCARSISIHLKLNSVAEFIGLIATQGKGRIGMTKQNTLTCLLALSFMAAHGQYALAQTARPSILQLDEVNLVNYSLDIGDVTKAATSSAITPAAIQPTFQKGTGIGDIVAVNGQAVKGTHIITYTRINSTPIVTPGQAIADVTRGTVIFHFVEIQGADGTAIGTITGQGFSRGEPPPGSSAAVTTSNAVITGGTGAFAGARGFLGTTNPQTSVPNRSASFVEDPAYRRVNGGGTARYIFTLYPYESPQIIAIAHADYSLVSAAKPTIAGETLIMIATGLGPTRPGVEVGQNFPSSPLAAVNSPIAVTVNGTAAPVLGAVGYPGSTDRYQVNFQVPSGLKGMAQVQVSAAWMTGPAWTINVQ